MHVGHLQIRVRECPTFLKTNDPILKRVFLQTISVVFVVTAVVSCTRKPTIYANHDVTACGVKDPLVNLPWLAELCKNSFKEGEVSIFLIQDTITQDYFFETNRVFELYERGKFSRGECYNCEGDTVMIYNTITPPKPEEVAFDKDKKHLGVIFKVKYK